MTREAVSSPNRSAVNANTVRLAEFIEMLFPEGAVRATMAARHIDWGGYTWLGDGKVLSVVRLTENTDIKPRRSMLRLSAIDATVRARLTGSKLNYSECNIYLGLFDEAWQLLDTPVTLAKHLLMSFPRIRLANGEQMAELSLETYTLLAQRDSAVLATPESQRVRFAGDRGLDRVAYIATQDFQWGGQYVYAGTDLKEPMDYHKRD